MPRLSVRYIKYFTSEVNVSQVLQLTLITRFLKERSSDFRLIFEETINTNEAHVYAAKQLNPHLDNGLQFTIISKTLNEYPLDYLGKTLLNLSSASSGVFLV